MPRTKEPNTVAASNGQAVEAESIPDGKPARGQIVIPGLKIARVEIEIVGTSSLICHAFPDKVKREMKEKRQKDENTEPKPKGKGGGGPAREVRDFDAEYMASLYPLDGMNGRYGHPSIAFKRAIVDACRMVSNLDMTMANRIIFVTGPYYSKGFNCVEIIGKHRKREDMVRLAGMEKPPDVRYRAEFPEWRTKLSIEFNASMISIEGIYNLVQSAGWSIGVGEQRPGAPKKSGDNGRFALANRVERK